MHHHFSGLHTWRVVCSRASDLVQKHQFAQRELAPEPAITKLDKYRTRQAVREGH